MLENSEGEI